MHDRLDAIMRQIHDRRSWPPVPERPLVPIALEDAVARWRLSEGEVLALLTRGSDGRGQQPVPGD